MQDQAMKSLTPRVILRIARYTACAILLSLSVTSAYLSSLTIRAQQASPSPQAVITLDGHIRNESGKAVPDATVFVTATGDTLIVKTKSNADGSFRVILNKAGTYRIEAEKTGVGSAAVEASRLELGDAKRCDLMLSPTRNAPASSSASRPTAGGFEFNDEPNFTVAGVTDWSNAGLHGSDARARTSDALTKETVALNGAAEKSVPASSNAAYDLAIEYREKGDFVRARAEARKSLAASDTADGHRLLGELDERLGDSLEAVREFELAVRMDPSEQNYFAWGTELLLHKAAQPAAEVFAKGSSVHPNSARLLAGLGVALYVAGSYDEAARRLCAASDLKPADRAPYLFLGEIEKSSPAHFTCSKERFARFVREQPENALANYYYAISLWKGKRDLQNQPGSQETEQLLEKAIKLDSKLTDAYVQLGVLRAARGDFAAAIENYKRALAVDPGSSDAHYRLGLAYKRTGEDAKARQELDAYQRARNLESASAARQRREMKQFSIIFKDPSATPEVPNSRPR
jgi:tetratricopeptide (TPR) repeat protein